MYKKLESLRGVAALLVVMYHSPFNFSEKEFDFVSNSYMFVDFFFILSGFVMSFAYYNRIADGMAFKTYLLLRLGRIYPLHMAVLLLWVPYIIFKQYLFISGFGGSEQLETNNIGSFFTNMFLLQTLGIHDYLAWNYPSWSIGAEFFTYIIFYLLISRIDRKQSLLVPITVSVVCYSLLLSLGKKSFDISYDYGLFRCLAGFYLGVFVYRMSSHFNCFDFIRNNIFVCELACVSGIVFIVSIVEENSLLYLTGIITFAFSIYVFSFENSGLVGRVLLKSPFRKIGLWSYSIYMLHAIIVAGFANVFRYVLNWDVDGALKLHAIWVNLFLLLVVVSLSKVTYNSIEFRYRNKSRSIVKSCDN